MTDPAVVVAVVGVVGAAIGAALSSWLGARQHVAQEMRDLRLQHYPAVWKRTSVVSRWPQTDATRAHLARLHLDLRTWYYSPGGMCLSTNARDRYGEFQTLISLLVNEKDVDPTAPLSTSDYDAVKDAASAFRTAMTEDLQTRDTRSLVRTAGLWLRHLEQGAKAQTRIRERSGRAVEDGHRHEITREDEVMGEATAADPT